MRGFGWTIIWSGFILSTEHPLLLRILSCLGAYELSGLSALPPSTRTSVVLRVLGSGWQSHACQCHGMERGWKADLEVESQHVKPSRGVSQPAHGVCPLLPCPGAAGCPKWGRGAICPPKPPPLHPILLRQQGSFLLIPNTLQLSVGMAELCMHGEGAPPTRGQGAGQGWQQSPPMPWGRVLLHRVQGRCLCRKEREGAAAWLAQTRRADACPVEIALDGHLYCPGKQLLCKIRCLSYSSSITTVKITPMKFYIRWIKRNSLQ